VLAKDEQEPKLVRPRDLSIYPDESKEKKVWAWIINKQKYYDTLISTVIFVLYLNNNFNHREKENNWEPTIALGSIQKVRDEIVYFNQQLSQAKERMYRFVQTGISHSECKYLLTLIQN